MTLTITSGKTALTARPLVPSHRPVWLVTWLPGPPGRETSRP